MSQLIIHQEDDSISSTVVMGNRANRNMQTALSILPNVTQHRYTDGDRTNIPIQTSLTILPDQSNTEILPLFSLKPEERTIVLWKKRSQGDGLPEPQDILDTYNYQQLLDECSNEHERAMTLAIASAIDTLSRQLLNLKNVYEHFLESNLKDIEKPDKTEEEIDENMEEIEGSSTEEKPRKISVKITDITISCFNLEKLTFDADEFPMDRTFDPIEQLYVPARNITTFRETFPMPRNTSMVAMFEKELDNDTQDDLNSSIVEESHPRVMLDTDIGRPVPFCPLCICEHEIQPQCPGGCNYFEIWGTMPLNNPSDQLPFVDSFCPPRAMFDYDLLGMTPPLSLRDRIVRPGGAMLDVDLTEVELPILCTCGRAEDPELECNCEVEKLLLNSWSVQELVCDICLDDTRNQDVQAMFDTDLSREPEENKSLSDRSTSTGKRFSNETESLASKAEQAPEIISNKIETTSNKLETASNQLETTFCKSTSNQMEESASAKFVPDVILEEAEISIPEEPEFIYDVELLTDSEIAPMWDTDLGRLPVPFQDTDDTDSIDSVKNDRAMFDFDLLGASRPEPPFELRRVKQGGAMFDVDIGNTPDLGNPCFCVLHMLPSCICGCAFEHLYDQFGIGMPEDEDENLCAEDVFHIERPMFDYDLLGGKRPPVDPKSKFIVSGGAMFDFHLLYEGDFEFVEVPFNENMHSTNQENLQAVAMYDYNLYGGILPKSEVESKQDTEETGETVSGGAMFDSDLVQNVEVDENAPIQFSEEDEGRPMYDYDLSSLQKTSNKETEKEVKEEEKVDKEEHLVTPMFDLDLNFEIKDEGEGKEEQILRDYDENQSDTDEVMHDYNLSGWIETPPPPYIYKKKIELSNPMFDTNLGKNIATTSLCTCDESWSEECPCGCKYYEFYKEVQAKQKAENPKPQKTSSNISNFNERAMFDFDLHGGLQSVGESTKISDAVYDPDQEYVGLGKVCNPCMYDTDLGHLVSPEERTDYLEYFGDEVEKFPDGDDYIKPKEVYSDDRVMFDYHLYGGKRPKSESVQRRVVVGAAMYDTDLEHYEPTENEDLAVVDVEMLPVKVGLRGMFDYDLKGATVKLGSMDTSVDERIDCGCTQCESPMKSEENLIEKEAQISSEPNQMNDTTNLKDVSEKQLPAQTTCNEVPKKVVIIKEPLVENKKCINESAQRMIPNKIQFVDRSNQCQCQKDDKSKIFIPGDVKCLCKNVYVERKPKRQNGPSEKSLTKSQNQESSSYYSKSLLQKPSRSPAVQRGNFYGGVSISGSHKYISGSNQGNYEIPAKASKISYKSMSQQRPISTGFENFDDITLKYTEKSRRQQGVVQVIEDSRSGNKQGSFISTTSAHTHHTVETHSSITIRLQPSRSMTRRRRYPQSSTSINQVPSVYQSDVSHRFAPFLTGPLMSQVPKIPSQGPQDVTVVLAQHRPHRGGHRHKTTERSHQLNLAKSSKRPAFSPKTSEFRTGREPNKEMPTFIPGCTAVTSDPNDFPFLK